MADRHFLDAGNALQEILQIQAVQVMAGVHFQARIQCRLRAVAVLRQHLRLLWRAMGLRIGLGVQLDPVGAHGSGSNHL